MSSIDQAVLHQYTLNSEFYRVLEQSPKSRSVFFMKLSIFILSLHLLSILLSPGRSEDLPT